MKNKGQRQNMMVRIITSPFRALGKAKDFYIRSITNCGNSMNYSNPMDVAGRFEALPRSYSVAPTTKQNKGEDFAELMRAASDRTLMEKLDMDSVVKQKDQASAAKAALPKSVSVGMGRIDEDSPCEFGVAPLPSSTDLYPRSRSYAVTSGRSVVVF